jgi:hypothetical protein
MDNSQQQTVYTGPSPSIGTTNQQEPVIDVRNPKRTRLIVLTVIIVVIAAIATGYFLFARNTTGPFAERSESAEWTEYVSENGFAFSFPSTFQTSEVPEGFLLTGEDELLFKVGDMGENPLLLVVGESQEQETFTVDSRAGYKVSREDGIYYYFPLFNNNYLEIEVKGEVDVGEEIVSSLKFIAPQSAAIN